ncbi:hypothetical protein [Qipengyuania sphaerica]|uniref:hypothetical protein n=1 Tax=Qipengyuania sphaerica TaxID=2867243 RepID=UPI001C86F681|nr:hypothetical protein [Qipengyuania sphaerica]MBX7541767.1 hypothetical protein [Qipengyuania sphaerica]
MNFSGLKRLIESADEHAFYDVALLQLRQLGYGDLHVVDGPYDGGKDVESDRKHVQIQLSVRKDWEKKIKEESLKALKSGARHILFLTNRRITPRAEANFLSSYPYKNQLELTIYDSSRIATNLSQPGRIAQSYKLLGVEVKGNTKFSVSDIAASVALLFGDEASELREATADSVALSWLRFHTGASEEEAIAGIAGILPGVTPERLARSSLSRLRIAGEITGPKSAMALSDSAKAKVDSAESELIAVRAADIQTISDRLELPQDVAEELLDISIELTIRSQKAGWSGAIDDELAGFLKAHGLTRKRSEINEIIANLGTVAKYSYIGTIDKLFSSNTFDIMRAFGGVREIKLVLDTSVTLPLLFGLEFGSDATGYSSASSVMKEVSDGHGFELFIPKPYLNEMASHGHKALDFLDLYSTFEPELRGVMRASPNAYLSHYAAISERAQAKGEELLSLQEFLEHFGIRRGSTIGNAERVIRGLMEAHQIFVVWDGRYDQAIKDEIAEQKPHHPEVVVKHDAAVCSKLNAHASEGFIFATWDKVLIDLLHGRLSVYADNPGRIVDWLAFTQGIETGIDGSVEILAALAIVDEGKAAKLAEKLQAIESEDAVFKLNQIIRDTRKAKGVERLESGEVEEILDVELASLVAANDDEGVEDLPSVPEG